MNDNRPYTFDRVVRMLLTAGVLGVLIWLAGYLSDVLIPLAVAFLLAYLLNPLVALVQKKVYRRGLAVLVSLLGVVVAVLLLGWVLTPMIGREIAQMGTIVSDVVSDAQLAEKVSRYLPQDVWKALRDFLSRPEIQGFFKTADFWKALRIVAGKVMPGVWSLITGTASFLIGLVGLAVIGLYLIFILLDYERFSQGWKALLPPAYRAPVTEFMAEFEDAMSRYFRGQAAVAAICGGLFAAGFVLVGLPLGILLGLFVGLLNMVPYLQIIGLIPAFFLALFHALESGSSILVVLGLTGAVFVVVQVIQDAFLTPRIMGKVTGLNPAMILLSISIWGKLLGFLGLIIALPMTYLVLAYYRRFLAGDPAAKGDKGLAVDG